MTRISRIARTAFVALATITAAVYALAAPFSGN